MIAGTIVLGPTMASSDDGRRFEIGAFIGAHAFLGEIDPATDSGVAFGFRGGYLVRRWLSIETELEATPTHADDASVLIEDRLYLFLASAVHPTAVRVQGRSSSPTIGSTTGVEAFVTCTSNGASCPSLAPATSGEELTPEVSQTIDYGGPLAAEATGWRVVVVYTFKPATL